MINFEKYKNEISGAMNGHYTTFGFQDMKECLKKIADVDMAFWSDVFYWGMQEWKPEMTNLDRFIISNSSSDWHWIARDDNGTLGFYKNVPLRCDTVWCDPDNDGWLDLNRDIVRLFKTNEKDMFSFVTWGDDEPWSIDELKNSIKDE